LITDEVLSSDDVIQSNSDSDVDKVVGVQSGSVFLPKSVALSYLRSQRSANDDGGLDRRAAHRIQRRGIVCECCVHQCNYNEIKMYCQRPEAHHGKRSVLRQSSSNVPIPTSSSMIGSDDQQRPMPTFTTFGSPLSATLFHSTDNGGYDVSDRD